MNCRCGRTIIEEYEGYCSEKCRSLDWTCMHCHRNVPRGEENKKHECGYEPYTRKSQQPHGKSTLYCNQCGNYVTPTNWHGETVCPYHQRQWHGEEGVELMWDEFNQDGEEW